MLAGPQKWSRTALQGSWFLHVTRQRSPRHCSMSCVIPSKAKCLAQLGASAWKNISPWNTRLAALSKPTSGFWLMYRHNTMADVQELTRILVIRLSSLGDILLTTPILRVLREHCPTARIDFLTKAAYQDVLRANH